MTIKEIKEKLKEPQYGFLMDNPHLCYNIVLLGLGGSHAYGTNVETSDVDLRGVALNTKEEILTNKNFEQVEDSATDTVIYSFNKIISLLSSCNPNTIELLGLKPEHYLYISDVGRKLLGNRKLFISKRCVHSFGGYATSQLRRLDNKAVRLVEQDARERHILNSIANAKYEFPDKYFYHDSDAINLYVDKAVNPDFNTEIFMDVNLKHYPLRDYKSMWSEMQNIVKDYSKIGKRNKHAIEHDKLGKHMMHLTRLYFMAIDLLEKEEIITYREKEHDLLMSIRNGDYLDNNYQPTPDFYEMLNELEKRFEYAKNNTSLPDNPDYKGISQFMMEVNEMIVKGGENNG